MISNTTTPGIASTMPIVILHTSWPLGLSVTSFGYVVITVIEEVCSWVEECVVIIDCEGRYTVLSEAVVGRVDVVSTSTSSGGILSAQGMYLMSLVKASETDSHIILYSLINNRKYN
jgi:hypothetical protein